MLSSRLHPHTHTNTTVVVTFEVNQSEPRKWKAAEIIIGSVGNVWAFPNLP
jgi:hypothetical protein